MTRSSERPIELPGRPPASADFRRSARAPRTGKPAGESGALCSIAARIAASHYEVPLGDIAAPTRRSRRATRARHVAMYLAHVAFGLNFAVIAVALGRSRRMVARACGLVEDARDDPAFDAALAGLEISARILLDDKCAEKAA
jgi:hypothetical protein